MTRSIFRLFLIAAVLVGFGLASPLFGQEVIVWERDINIALAKAREANRLVFIHFYGPNCPPYELMEAEVFTNRQVIADMNRFFVPVKVDSSLNRELVKQFNIESIPTDVVLRGDGQFVHRRQGGISAERFDVYLNYINDEARPKNNSVHPVSPPILQPEQQPIGPVGPPAGNPVSPPSDPRQVVPPPVVDPRTLLAPPVSVPKPPERGNPIRPDTPEVTVKEIVPHEVIPFAEGTTGPTVEIPLALDGFCPVTLASQERWQPGNPLYYAMYCGQIFRCISEETLETFAKEPAKYAPVAMGEDVVQMVNRQKKIVGQRKFGAWFQDRVYLFSSQESLDTFASRPEFYAEIALKYETALRPRFDAVQR